MSPRDKQQLYHSLAQLIRVGVTFPAALDKLAKTAKGPARRTVKWIRQGLDSGKTVAEACASSGLSGTEIAVLTAVEHAGSLDRGLEQLSRHFGAVATARGRVMAKLAYPIFVLLLAVVLLNLPTLVREGAEAYLRATLPVILGTVASVVAIYIGGKIIGKLAASSALVDALVRTVPLIGGMQSAFAMARFCLVYELQLGASINVMNALEASGEASRSGLVRRAIRKIVPQVRAGNQAGPLLAESGAFEPHVADGIMVGEETGSLSNELRRLAETESERAFGRLEAMAEWLPRLFYVGVLLYTGWLIVNVFREYLKTITSLLDQM